MQTRPPYAHREVIEPCIGAFENLDKEWNPLSVMKAAVALQILYHFPVSLVYD